MSKIQKEFYLRTDTLVIAKELLGKVLCTSFRGISTSGIICETEAYCGTEDRGSHAFGGRFTERTKIMYAEGGVSYVYLCYGIHHMFNVVTHVEAVPHAVLVRAIQPLEGIEHMLRRRKKKESTPVLGAGPGIAAECLGIKTKHNGLSLTGSEIWIEDRGIPVGDIVESARVGMSFEGPYKTIPWRFRIAGSAYTSRAK
ncbi:MAG: DNA-3-methyladenine glycosylase [Chitinophagales bacterium]